MRGTGSFCVMEISVDTRLCVQVGVYTNVLSRFRDRRRLFLNAEIADAEIADVDS